MMTDELETKDGTSDRYRKFDQKTRVTWAIAVTLIALLVDGFVLWYCYEACDCEPWNKHFAGGRGLVIELGRHAILLPLVTMLVAFRFGVTIRHFFGARYSSYAVVFRVLLAVLVVAIFVCVWRYHFSVNGCLHLKQ